ncbi:MAG: DegT/DnrJ/EryC1/StrS family aminotransferase [Fibrobacteres bacterium]|nr:DegT/DnrJ/EryC1/StrS family aminotransferase [Fibrobacterota bacterium]
MTIPMLDLKAQYQTIKAEIDSAVAKTIESQIFINGPVVEKLEESIGKYLGGVKALGVSSGTDAILLALMAMGIGEGDEVITTPYTFFATAGCIARVGARPVFVDVHTDTYNINADLIEKAITPKTKAIIPVHLFGQTAAMDPILAIASKHGLRVIEDGAQAIGATYKGRPACTMGDVGTLSFFPSKNLGGFGDGGMVITKDDTLYAKMKSMRNHGQGSQYHYDMVGGNFRLDALQAAVLSVKLPYLELWSAKRRRNASFYNNRFANSKVKTPVIRKENLSIFNQYVIEVEDGRDALVQKLKEKGIATAVYYPLPLHLQKCFESFGGKVGDCPVAEEAAKKTLALPIYPELTEEQLNYIADAILADK